MVISYTDYLLDDCNRAYYSYIGLSNPSNFSESVLFNFLYKFSYDEKELDKQATVFCDQVRSDSVLSKIVDLNIQGSQVYKNEVVANVYKYSFIKTFSLCYEYYISGKANLGAAPTNSLVFYGHKELFLLFIYSNVFYNRMGQKENTQLNKNLTIDLEAFEEIQKSPVYKESVNDLFPGYINSPTYERLLDGFRNSGSSIQVEYLDHGRIKIDPQFTPLGNMAYRKNQNLASDCEYLIDTVTTKRSHTDHISKFWNIANFISIENHSEQFNIYMNYPYISIDEKMIPSTSLFAQVESITGIKCGNKYSNYGSGIPGMSGYNKGNNIPPKGPTPKNSGPNKKSTDRNSKPSSKEKSNGKPLTKSDENRLKAILIDAANSGIVNNLAKFTRDIALTVLGKKLDEETAIRLQRQALESSGYIETKERVKSGLPFLSGENQKITRTPMINYRDTFLDDQNNDEPFQ